METTRSSRGLSKASFCGNGKSLHAYDNGHAAIRSDCQVPGSCVSFPLVSTPVPVNYCLTGKKPAFSTLRIHRGNEKMSTSTLERLKN